MTKYICTNCGKEFTIKAAKIESNKVWCKGCKLREYYSNNSEARQKALDKKKKTMLDKYGFESASQSPEIRKKISENARARFADPDLKKQVLDKRAATNIEKYGYKAAAQNPEITRKGVAKQRAHLGYVGFEDKETRELAQQKAHTEAANEKRKATSLKNHGTTHHFKNKEVLDKQWESYKEKTGYDHPAHNPEVVHSTKGYLFEDQHFDSSWELAYYIWLRDNNKSFLYHPPYYLDYLDSGNEAHQYQPDFLVEGTFVEIKGDQFFNEKGEPYNSYTKSFWWCKYNALKENNVQIKRFDEIKECLRYIKEKYGKDYLKSFKRK